MAEECREEQASEIDALISIYGDEIKVVGEDPYCVEINIKETLDVPTDEDTPDLSVSTTLQFTLEGEYPNSLPVVDIVESENLTDGDKQDLKRVLTEEAENNLGMVMIFTLVSAAQEYVNGLHDKLKDRKRKEKELAKRKEQEEHEKKFHGTPVTIETFTAWRIGFEEEFYGQLKRAEEEAKLHAKRLTGRQLFERDSSLKDSDAQFFAEGGVEVDESLFQELGDLDLEEDLE